MLRYTYYISLFLLALAPIDRLSAQISQGGTPVSFNRASELQPPVFERMPAIDLEMLAAQDQLNDQDKSIPFRFGYNFNVAFDLENSGTWNILSDGRQIWQLGIECPDALSINFVFDRFNIPDGAKIFVMNEFGDHIGAFTNANDHGDHVLGVQAMKGERIVIEYSVPAGIAPGELRIGQVTHGYRDVFKYARGLGDSGSCNNNVICPEGNPWANQIRSVAMITVNGNGICTGTLINNCAQDATPYFLTARHCLPSGNNVSTWVFRFNWNSPSCTLNQNGPTNQTVSGATLLAQNAGSDMALLQLNSVPPASYQVYYSGWDKSGATPSSQTAIHHPSGDVKKISFDTDAAGQATYGSALCWRIFDWEDGTTEPGSSGSGLWDQNQRLIGQLYGGQASCSNNVNDYYGRLDISYPVIQQWLGTCGNTVNGYDPNMPTLALDAQLQSIQGTNNSSCSSSISPSAVIRNGGTSTITSFQLNWAVSGGGSGSQSWSGDLTSGSTVTVALGSISIPAGANTFSVTVNNPNNGVDQNTANNQAATQVVYGNNMVTLDLTLDRYGDETTWEIKQGSTIFASGGPYTQAATNGAYPQAPISICLPDGCYDLIVRDSYGDGMCCAYGNGSFSLSNGQSVLAAGGSFTTTSTNAFCVQQQIQLSAKVRLEGPYVSASQLMNDQLRSGSLIPLTEPYTAAGYVHVGGGGETIAGSVLTATGNNAIVDWVVIELRGGSPSYSVLASRSALLQRDGDIVDLNGTSPVSFPIGTGNYRVAVRHRNHLAIMTSSAIALSTTTTSLDLSSNTVATYGTNARKNINGILVMWAGNSTGDDRVRYTGSGNDRDPILLRIGGTVPTNTASGYYPEDLNMDGTTRYTGGTNDRDLILQNIGGTIPTNTLQQQLP